MNVAMVASCSNSYLSCPSLLLVIVLPFQGGRGGGDSKCQSRLSIDTTLYSGLGIVLTSEL